MVLSDKKEPLTSCVTRSRSKSRGAPLARLMSNYNYTYHSHYYIYLWQSTPSPRGILCTSPAIARLLGVVAYKCPSLSHPLPRRQMLPHPLRSLGDAEMDGSALQLRSGENRKPKRHATSEAPQIDSIPGQWQTPCARTWQTSNEMVSILIVITSRRESSTRIVLSCWGSCCRRRAARQS